MLRSNLCDYADSYILVKGTITIIGAGDDAAARRADERNKRVTFKNCAPFTKCLSRINNTDIENAHDIDIVMPMYNLIEYSDNYSKISGSLWQYYKDDPNDNLADSESFKSKIKIVLSFENENDTTSHSTYYLPKVEIKDYNVMIDGRNFFDQPINSINKT